MSQRNREIHKRKSILGGHLERRFIFFPLYVLSRRGFTQSTDFACLLKEVTKELSEKSTGTRLQLLSQH